MKDQINRPGRKWILIVEDDPNISKAIQLALELEGYSSLAAPNGKIGINILDSEPLPSVIFLDLMMPVMDGIQFMAEVSKNAAFSKIPVVLVTAFTEKAGQISGIAGVIKKPINIDSLLEFAQKYCA